MKKLIAGVLTAMMICGSVTALAVDYGAEYQKLPTPQTVQKFSDVPNTHWAFDYIGEMAQRDVISGYPDGRFIPENQVTRAEFAKIMVCAAGLRVTNNNTSSFNDVYTSDWYCPYVECAKDYLTGYSTNIGTIYKPTTPALREDIAVALVKLKGYDISLADESILNMFTDSYSISSSARKYVAVAVERGIVSGYDDSTFRGQATITRAEAATLLWRAFQYGNDNKVVEPTETITETPKPVEQSQATEKPTATPKPTPKPTAEPTPTPEPTEEPTPEPTEKPYKVDTLVKADVSGSLYYTKDNSDNIYYAENGTIYKLDVHSKSTEEVFDTVELNIDNDEMALSDFEIESVCYDTYKDRLLLLGSYNSVNAINRVNNHYLYEVSGGNAEIITDNCPEDYSFIGTLPNGDLVDTRYIIDSETLKEKIDLFYNNRKTYDFYENDSEIYFCSIYVYYGFSSGRFMKYDYNGTEQLWSFPDDISPSAYCTLDNKVIVMTRGNEIYTYNFNGKQLNKIGSDDCKVMDKTKIAFSNVTQKLISIDDNIIFYDTNASAFRMISENK